MKPGISNRVNTTRTSSVSAPSQKAATPKQITTLSDAANALKNAKSDKDIKTVLNQIKDIKVSTPRANEKNSFSYASVQNERKENLNNIQELLDAIVNKKTASGNPIADSAQFTVGTGENKSIMDQIYDNLSKDIKNNEGSLLGTVGGFIGGFVEVGVQGLYDIGHTAASAGEQLGRIGRWEGGMGDKTITMRNENGSFNSDLTDLAKDGVSNIANTAARFSNQIKGHQARSTLVKLQKMKTSTKTEVSTESTKNQKLKIGKDYTVTTKTLNNAEATISKFKGKPQPRDKINAQLKPLGFEKKDMMKDRNGNEITKMTSKIDNTSIYLVKDNNDKITVMDKNPLLNL